MVQFTEEITTFDSDLDNNIFYIFKVKYRISGKDHDGYCSGAETDEDVDAIMIPEKYYKTYVTINEFDLPYLLDILKNDESNEVKSKYLSLFNHIHHGCNSEKGSHHCKGFAQKYNAIKAFYIESDCDCD